jgi:hypothetical protein
MKNTEAMKYKLNIQLFGEEDPVDPTEPTEPTEPVLDLDKFNKGNEPKEGELTEYEKLQKELEAERAKAKAAEERAAKAKAAFDKAASDRARLNRELQETEGRAEEPLEKLQEYEQKLKAYELNEKKTDLTYGLTEDLGISKDMSNQIVGAIYNEDTNELSIGDLKLALRELVNNVRKVAYEEGYKTRDTEVASGKPRSLGGQEKVSAAEAKRRAYLEQHGKL